MNKIFNFTLNFILIYLGLSDAKNFRDLFTKEGGIPQIWRPVATIEAMSRGFKSSISKGNLGLRKRDFPQVTNPGYLTLKVYPKEAKKCSELFYYEEVIRLGACFPVNSTAATFAMFSEMNGTVTNSIFGNSACSGAPLQETTDTLGCHISDGYKLVVNENFNFGGTSGYGDM